MSTLLAFPHPGHVSTSFMSSVLSTALYEAENDRLSDLEVLPVTCGPDLFRARNVIVDRFMATSHDFLWFVDSDMGFPNTALSNLITIATQLAPDLPTRPVVSALYFGQQPNPDAQGRMIPNPHMYRRVSTDPPHYVPATSFDTNALIRVDAVGAGCLLIHRSVFDAWNALPSTTTGMFSHYGELGEDFSFCARLSDLSIPLFVHTGIKTTHHKSTYLTEQSFMDYWRPE